MRSRTTCEVRAILHVHPIKNRFEKKAHVSMFASTEIEGMERKRAGDILTENAIGDFHQSKENFKRKRLDMEWTRTVRKGWKK